MSQSFMKIVPVVFSYAPMYVHNCDATKEGGTTLGVGEH